jgi:transposase
MAKAYSQDLRERVIVAAGRTPAIRSSWTIHLPTKRSGVRETIEATGGRLLYLLSYSPDFNPIENA